MDFELNEEQRMFRDSLRKFLDAQLRPLDDRWGDLEMTAERAKPLLKMLIPWGYADTEGILAGGSDPIIGCVQSEELSATFPGLSGMSGITSGAASLIAASAHPDLARRLVAPLSQADLIGCIATTEPEAGSDPSGIRSRAERKGDHWVINGAKTWISNGSVADIAVVLAQTDPAKGPLGFRHFVIDRRESPFDSREIQTIGLRSFPTSEMFFNDVEVPETNVLGGWNSETVSPERAFQRTLALFSHARAGTGMMAVGIARRAYEIALKYVQIRKQFGKEIIRHQLVAAMVAEMATEIDAARLLCNRAYLALRRGRADVEASMAKWYATEAAVKVASTAIQCMGANGLATENRVERCLRDARMLTMPDGTTQIQKLIIGRALTGKSAIR
ncbi:MAG: acyl-CoA dehydrogenase family protein [Candidatus Binatus sp.]|uniref:acyl-CoA dehydrogenase family protein n=1 Tax=Candidatus Binatus sp. TaxID=2811406 RepID=UPI003C749AF9